MAKFLTLDGLKIFLQKLQNEFLSKDSADSIYLKKADLETFIQDELEKIRIKGNQ